MDELGGGGGGDPKINKISVEKLISQMFAFRHKPSTI